MSLLPTLTPAQTVPRIGYRRLEGTIAGQEVVVNLAENQASYYYKRVGQPIYLQVGESDPAQNDTVNIAEWVSGVDESATWKLVFHSGGTATGLWTSGDSTRHGSIELHEAYPAGSYRFETLSLDDSIVRTIRTGIPISAHSTTFVTVPAPSIPDPDRTFLTAQIAKAMNCPGARNDLRSCIRATTKSYLDSTINDIQEQAQDVDDTDLEPMAYSLQWFTTSEIAPRFNDHGVVVFDVFGEDYTGGAHPNHGTELICLDVGGQRKLELRDITTATKATLRPLLEEYFRKQHGLKKNQPLTDFLFENKLEPNDNFYITDKGLGFLYQPYEVAAYAYGEVEVFIPFSALKGKLTPWVTQHFGLPG